MAVINVGAATETAMKETKPRIEDALHTTKAAVEEGIVPGGGTAYHCCIAKASVVVDKVREDKNANGGHNAASDKYVDMIKAGIIAPTKVSRCALQNAASVAGLILTTKVMITELPEEKKGPCGFPVGGLHR